MRLPKVIRDHKKHDEIRCLITENSAKLWQGGEVLVPTISFSSGLNSGLQLARGLKAITLGMDSIKKYFSSRLQDAEGDSWLYLLVITNGGSERFYRQVESLIRKNSSILCLKVDIEPIDLGQKLFKKDKAIKSLLVNDPQAMAKVLFYMLSK